jgi:hypothetical protein
MADARELAWAAGLFEGEGCIALNKANDRRGAYARLSLNMNDEDSVRRFHDAVGVGYVSGPHLRPDPKHKPYWNWYISAFEPVQHVIASLWYGLGERRKARAREVLAAVVETQRRITMPQKSHPWKRGQ